MPLDASNILPGEQIGKFTSVHINGLCMRCLRSLGKSALVHSNSPALERKAPMLLAHVLCEVLPRLLGKPNCRLRVSSKSKKLCQPTKLKLLFTPILEEHIEEYTIIYTDGSKTESLVRSSFVNKVISHSWSLSKARKRIHRRNVCGVASLFPILWCRGEKFLLSVRIQHNLMHFVT